MNKKTKVRITNDGVKGFFGRAREHARKLDRGEELAPEITISFENASDMMRVLSPQRVRVLRVARQGAPRSLRWLAALSATLAPSAATLTCWSSSDCFAPVTSQTPDTADKGSWSRAQPSSNWSQRSRLRLLFSVSPW
jgi:hypothetical protein